MRKLALGAVLFTGLTAGHAARAAEPAAASAASAPSAAPPSNAPIDLDDMGLAGVTQAPLELPQPTQVRVDGLALLHFADGIGAGGQLRAGPFGLRATLGFETMFFFADDNTEDAKLGSLEFASGLQLNVDTLLVFGQSERGASIGYRYNTVLGHGAAIAYQSVIEAWGQRFAFSVPVIYFPKGTSLAREELDLSSRQRINFPFGAGLQYGAGVAWMF